MALYEALAWTSEQLGRAVVARVETFPATPDPGPPPGALVLPVRWPAPEVMLRMPEVDAPGWHAWAGDLLGAVIDGGAELGVPERLPLAKALLRAWRLIERRDDADELVAYGTALRALSGRLRRLPSELMERPVPALMYDFRLLARQHGDAAAAAQEEAIEEFLGG